MNSGALRIAIALGLLLAWTAGAHLAAQSAAPPQQPRPMTFLDMQQLKQAGSPTPSPDGKWLLYTLSTPDWKEAKRQTDIYLVSVQRGVPSTKQMTFTKEQNETSPGWTRDGSAFFFLSNRDAPENAATRNQLYMMRPDGGEARRITDAKEGVSNYAASRDGRWLVYRTGKPGEEQL
jgi:Tol biopolymer transport system component